MPQEASGFLRFLSYKRFCLALLAYEKARCLLTRGKMEQPPTAFLLKTKFFVKKGLTVGGRFAIITFVDETHLVGEWCNGNTSGSDPAILGSNPSSPAIHMPPWSSGQDVALSRRNQGFDSPWRCQMITEKSVIFFYFLDDVEALLL